MAIDVTQATAILLFLALFPMAFIWLRRAWRIVVRRDFSQVALKRGESPTAPERFAPFAAIINLLAGVVIAFVIFGVVVIGLEYRTWTSIAGMTIWGKLFADFLLARHAHPLAKK